MTTLKTTFATLLSLKKWVLIILPALLMFNCSPEDITIDNIDTTTTLIAKSNLYGGGAEDISQQNIVITDNETWESLKHQMNTVNNVSNTFSESDIDFSVYQLIAVFDSVQNSGGHSIDLDMIWNSDSVIVNVINSHPVGNAASVMTQPFHIVKIKNTDLPILFE